MSISTEYSPITLSELTAENLFFVSGRNPYTGEMYLFQHYFIVVQLNRQFNGRFARRLRDGNYHDLIHNQQHWRKIHIHSSLVHYCLRNKAGRFSAKSVFSAGRTLIKDFEN